MAYENVNETVRKCVLGDSLRIRTHSLWSLYSCVAQQPNSGLCCIKFERFQYHTQLDTYALPLWLPCTRDQLVPDTPTYATHNKHNGRTSKPFAGFRNRTPSNQAAQPTRSVMYVYHCTRECNIDCPKTCAGRFVTNQYILMIVHFIISWPNSQIWA